MIAMGEKEMTCRRCSAKMYHVSLKYEGSGPSNLAASSDTLYYKCPICAHQQYFRTKSKKKVYVKGQRVKGVFVDPA